MFEGLLQPMHLIIILVIVLIIFGPGKLAELGNSIDKAIKGFNEAMDEPEHKPDFPNYNIILAISPGM